MFLVFDFAGGEKTSEDLLWSVEEQDDIVAMSVQTLLKEKKINISKVPALTDKTFPGETQETSLTMVLFYLTCEFCDRNHVDDFFGCCLINQHVNI